jgi:DNA-nicking Smr family endonuclease
MRKKNKDPQTLLPEKLDADERELFLNAYYQGGFVDREKFTEVIPDKQIIKTAESLEDSERDLFIRAVNEGLEREKVALPPVALIKPPALKRAQKRSMIDARIDLHGMFVEDASLALLRFLDNEKRRGAKTLLIIHGKGSGALKQAVWSLIETHPYVSDYQAAPGKLGGAGAILVRINRNVKRKYYDQI